ERTDRLRPAFPWRRTLPRTPGRTLSLRLEQPSGRQHHPSARIQPGAGGPGRLGARSGTDAGARRPSARFAVIGEVRRMTVISYMTNVLFENGALGELGARLPSLGISRPMIATDRGLVDAGLLDRVTRALGDQSCECIYADTPPNPTEEAVD